MKHQPKDLMRVLRRSVEVAAGNRHPSVATHPKSGQVMVIYCGQI